MSQDYFAKHLSLSEWAIRANVSGRDALIQEDGAKRKRLAFLNRVIELPIVETRGFTYQAMVDCQPEFQQFLKEAGSRPYALRANPKVPGPPVLRNRKLPVADLVRWIATNDIDPDQYEYSFEPHIEPEVAAIFVVSESRIVGETIRGGILQLNKGSHASGGAVRFQFDFADWQFTAETTDLADFVKDAVRRLHVADPGQREQVQNEMGLGFQSDYLKGYFEVIWATDAGIVFIDYNRELTRTVDLLSTSIDTVTSADNDAITGQSGCIGMARGIARVVDEGAVAATTLSPQEVLVCRFTSPEFVPLMMQATAVVTDVGGVLSHAAIVCRELRKPCVVGTGVGTTAILTGDMIEVDGAKGIVRRLQRD